MSRRDPAGEEPAAARPDDSPSGSRSSTSGTPPEEGSTEEEGLLKRHDVQIVLLATLVSVVAVSGVTPAFPRIVEALGISQQQVGLLVTAFTVPGIVLTPFLGALADRIGRKAVLVPALVVFACAGTACAFVRGPFEWLLALRVVQGIGGAPIVALAVTILSDLFEAGPRRTQALGYNSAVLNLGTAAYPSVGGALAAVAWYWPFALAGAALPVGLVVLVALDTPEPSLEDVQSDRSLREVFLEDREVAGLLVASALLFVVLFGSYTESKCRCRHRRRRFSLFPSVKAMYLDYPDLIEESPEELARHERKHRTGPVGDRFKMLRLLKEGTCRSRRKLASVLGYSERQLGRWFDTYREGGLGALADRGTPGGSSERVTPEAWAGLEEAMKAGRIARLEDARRYLADEHGVEYTSIAAISVLFKRRGTKLKTGRRKNRKADPAKQRAFKK